MICVMLRATSKFTSINPTISFHLIFRANRSPPSERTESKQINLNDIDFLPGWNVELAGFERTEELVESKKSRKKYRKNADSKAEKWNTWQKSSRSTMPNTRYVF
jgi:hypothetical protein